MKLIKRIWINRMYIIKKAWWASGGLYGLFSTIALLAPTDEILSESISLGMRIFLSVLILLGVFVVISIFVGIYVCTNNKNEVLKAQKGYSLLIQYGDLFSKSVIFDKSNNPTANTRNIIVPVNCCFDTIVDDDLIAKGKIHGIAIEKLLTKMSREELDALIANKLQGKRFKQLNPEDKRKGNLKRYPFGTVVEIDAIDDSRYFLVALTEFNKDLHAEIHNRENYFATMQRLIEYIKTRSQGLPTIMPIIGGGLSEISTSEQTMLDTMVQMFCLNFDKINCDIHIVVRENGKDKIQILDY